MKPERLKEGDIIDICRGHSVYADIPRHFAYSNCKGDFALTHSLACVQGELEYLAGEYIVVKTALDGGGTGHGPHDVFPDGHHVYCERIPDRLKIDFYQSGAFTAMIKDIKPHGRAVLNWVKIAE